MCNRAKIEEYFVTFFKGNGTWNNPFDSFDESWSKYGNRRLLYLFPPITLEQWLIKKGVTEENTVVIKRGSASIELDRPCILKSWRDAIKGSVVALSYKNKLN